MNRAGWTSAGIVAAGLPAAVVWWWLAEPSSWQATERGLVLTELHATGAFQVVAVFTLIGLVFGFVSGVVTWWLATPARWQTAVALALATGAASVVCWQVGMMLGPGPVQDATDVAVGDTVPAPLAVDSVVPFLVWPLVAVVAYTVALYVSSDPDPQSVPRDDAFVDDLNERSTP